MIRDTHRAVRSFFSAFAGALGALLLIFAGLAAPSAGAQSESTGTVTVSVVDQSGGAVVGVQLQLQALATNDVRNAVSLSQGNYSFVNLPLGTYKLSATKSGFDTVVQDSVEVHAAQVTDVVMTLKVSAITGEKVEVTASATPLIDTTSNAISTNVDVKQIEDLPLLGRDVSQLEQLVPGYTGFVQNPGNQNPLYASGVYGTWNGLPSIAQSNNVDGVVGNTSRMKFVGDTQPALQVQVQDIQEMTVQTDQINANQGFGQGAMQANFVTRQGSNSFHGRLYEDFQNSYLNANSWYNDAAGLPKGHQELNQFGGSLGGPIIHNKLFFFGSYGELKTPSTVTQTATVLTAAAQQGNYTYVGSDGANHTVNVFTLAANCNAQGGSCNNGQTLPTSPAAAIINGSNGLLDQVNGILSKGRLTAIPGEPSQQTLNWTVSNAVTEYFPAARVDYNLSQSLRVNFAWNQTKFPPTTYGFGFFPGFPKATYHQDYTTGSLGIDWTVSPTLVNSFRGGILYNLSIYNNSAGFDKAPALNFAIANSPQQFYLATGQYYPLFNFSDTATWQHGAHTANFGVTWYQELDHYYNPPGGIYQIGLGLGTGDGALNAFQAGNPGIPSPTNGNLGDLQNLYATLTGRVNFAGTGGLPGNYVNPATGQYSSDPRSSYELHELSRAWGLSAQDSFRLRSNLTLNYALRWDFTGDNYDETGQYHGITRLADMYGPSGLGNLFRPGVLQGPANGGTIAAQKHQYHPWDVSPQPQVGIAWSPNFSDGVLGKLAGGGSNMVVRAGFSLRDYTEPYQYFWDAAADYGNFFFQHVSLASCGSTGAGSCQGQLGYFPVGTLQLQSNMLCYPQAVSGCTNPIGTGALSFSKIPPTYVLSAPESQFEFSAAAPPLAGIDPYIKQPYTEEWNLGIQRSLGRSNAIEISYHGSRSPRQWINLNLNEVNILENNLLAQFKQAQTNLTLNNSAANAATYPAYAGTFAYNSAVAGEASTPIFDAAFAGEPLIPGTSAPEDYGFGYFTNVLLPQGQAGAMAYQLTQTSSNGGANYICNLVGSNLSPCNTVFGFNTPGPYAENFLQVNPFYTGQGTTLLEAGGYSNYNGLQVDFRQKGWHGMQFDANWTWSHTLGLSTPNSWTGSYNQLTLRNLRLGYGPTLFDFRHAIHASGTYDLPFGKGKQFLNSSALLDRAVGGWTIGTVFFYETGSPFNLYGGYSTFNDYADGGVVLNGVTRQQLQDAVGVYRIPGSLCGGSCPFVDTINPKLLASATGGLANAATNQALLYPNMSPGTLLAPIYLYGPHNWNEDLSVTKAVAIRENLRFTLQGEFLNAFNHPNFGPPASGVAFGNFGTAGGPGGEFGRIVELRANLEF